MMFFRSNNKANDEDIEILNDEIDNLNDKIDNLNDKIDNLIEKNDELNQKNKILQEQLQQKENATVLKEQNASFIVDFNKISAFSIERSKNKTVIGYLIQTTKGIQVKEWYLACSLEVHEKLAQDFQNYINTKK